MADANVRASDPRNYQMVGKVSLWFKPKGATDFVDLGNVINPELVPALTRLDHFSIRRGVRAKDKSVITERSANLNLSIDEINLPNLQFAFISSQPAQADQVDVNDDRIVANPGGGQQVNLNVLDINPGSVRVKNLNHEDEFVFVENTHYTVDYAQGIITILNVSPINNLDPESGYPELHVQYQKNVATQSFEGFPGQDVNGQAQFQILTDSGIKVVATFGNVNMRNNGAIKFGDGSKYEEIGLQLEILEDSLGKLCTIHIPNDGELP